MISCIICSRRPDISAELKENIASTIGCEYELVVIDNSKNEYSIFSAYNEGVRRAKGDVLCFMHEDIVYHSEGWGNKVKEYFAEHLQAGLLGVAGTHYFPALPAAQWDSEIASSHIIQGEMKNGKYVSQEIEQNQYKKNPTEMVAVDGLWLCMRKKVFDFVSWDEKTFNGFHCYDTDMAFQVWRAGYEVHLFWEVLIEHKSLGNANTQFMEACEQLYLKWKEYLPLTKGVQLSNAEQQAINSLCELKVKYREEEKRHEEQIKSITTSYAYIIGKKIVKPFAFLKRIFK
jgi:glycosyltransferase involved in cell wall biosynthesis